MRHLHQRTGNGDVATAFDGLAVGKELLPRVIRPRHRNAAGFQHRLIDKEIFPIPGGRNGVMLSVRSLREHGLLHIGSVVRVNFPDVLNGDHPPGVDDGSASALVKKNSTSGSEPVSKSASTLAFQPRWRQLNRLLLVAGGCFRAATASKVLRLPSSPP